MNAIDNLFEFDEKVTLTEASKMLDLSPVEVLSLADPKSLLYDATFPIIFINTNGDHRISKKALMTWQEERPKRKSAEGRQGFVTSKQLACFFSVQPATVRRWVVSGKIPKPDIVAPRLLRWKQSTLKDFLEKPGDYLSRRGKKM